MLEKLTDYIDDTNSTLNKEAGPYSSRGGHSTLPKTKYKLVGHNDNQAIKTNKQIIFSQRLEKKASQIQQKMLKHQSKIKGAFKTMNPGVQNKDESTQQSKKDALRIGCIGGQLNLQHKPSKQKIKRDVAPIVNVNQRCQTSMESNVLITEADGDVEQKIEQESESKIEPEIGRPSSNNAMVLA